MRFAMLSLAVLACECWSNVDHVYLAVRVIRRNEQGNGGFVSRVPVRQSQVLVIRFQLTAWRVTIMIAAAHTVLVLGQHR